LTEHLFELSDSNWVIEVDVLTEPLNGGVSEAVSDHSKVNRVDVLHSALGTEPVVGTRQGLLPVADSDGKGVPLLLYLWIGVLGDVQIIVNSFYNGQSDFT